MASKIFYTSFLDADGQLVMGLADWKWITYSGTHVKRFSIKVRSMKSDQETGLAECVEAFYCGVWLSINAIAKAANDVFADCVYIKLNHSIDDH